MEIWWASSIENGTCVLFFRLIYSTRLVARTKFQGNSKSWLALHEAQNQHPLVDRVRYFVSRVGRASFAILPIGSRFFFHVHCVRQLSVIGAWSREMASESY